MVVAVAFQSEEEVVLRRDPLWPIFDPSWIRPWWPICLCTCAGPGVLHPYQVSSKSIKRICSKGQLCVPIHIHALMQPPFFHLKYIHKQEAWRATIVHISTSFWNGTPAKNDLPERQTSQRMLRTCLQSSFFEFDSAIAEKSKMSQPIRGRGSHFVFHIGLKNTNLVEDVRILLPVKFLWIPFSSFRGEVKNDSANQRPGGHDLVFPIGPKTTTLEEDIEILLPVKVH